jgi:Transposase DDE domain
MDLTLLFCEVDDFCKEFFLREPTNKIEDGKPHRNRAKRLAPSEIMTILIYFHASGYRDFKHFYINHVIPHLAPLFPGLLSYTRFVAVIPSVLLPMCSYLSSRFDNPTGISYIDATKIEVCHKKRISRNKVFKGLGEIGKTTMGWFFGFKLNLIINEQGGLLAVKLTAGNVDDRRYVSEMSNEIYGKLFGDKGYISQKLFEELWERGLKLVTNVRSNMKNKLMPMIDKILLRKRSIIETVNDQLKNISQIEHTRHRSVWNFMVNLLCGLIAYTFQEKKPHITGVDEIRNLYPAEYLLAA